MSVRKSKEAYVGLFGNAAVITAWCKSCSKFSFVLEGELQCCDALSSDIPTKWIQEIQALDKRLKPSSELQTDKLIEQEWCCAYCERRFGDFVYLKGKRKKLQVQWDHFVPYSYSRNNNGSNFVASCHICNRMKSSFCFETMEEAKLYLLHKWTEKGYTNFPSDPDVPSN
jgi:hypothetical protein